MTCQTAAESLAGPYGITTEAFIEFLRTLGVRTETGDLKQSFSIIKSELKKGPSRQGVSKK